MRWAALLLVVLGCSDKVSTAERTRVETMRFARIAAARAERCIRPALRTPAGGDESATLARAHDRKSAEGACLAQVSQLTDAAAHPELIERCAPLFAAIERVAHATEACSPFTLDETDAVDFTPWFALDRAVAIQNAPLLAGGDLAGAARNLTNALRVADDIGRNGTVMGLMLSVAATERLGKRLAEILVDPRLTIVDAREIAGDLDAVFSSGPTFEAMMRQESAWVARSVTTPTFRETDPVQLLLDVEQRERDIAAGCACGQGARACAEHLDTVTAGDVAISGAYVRRLGARDVALAALRMQAELRMARREDCADPVRRRALLARWLPTDGPVLGDQREPVVAPPAWQTTGTTTKRPTWVIRCVAAT